MTSPVSPARRSLLRTADLMHGGADLPSVRRQASVRDALLEVSKKGLGMTTILNADGTLAGLFTDGDLRRALDRGIDILATPVSAVMTSQPATIFASRLATEAVQLMETRRINGLLVVDEQANLIGALNMHDLLRAGVV